MEIVRHHKRDIERQVEALLVLLQSPASGAVVEVTAAHNKAKAKSSSLSQTEPQNRASKKVEAQREPA